jgi:hypothetical protein
MDEEKKPEQNNIDNKMKEAVSNELTSYINPDNSPSSINQQKKLSSEISKSLDDLGLKDNQPIQTPIQTQKIIRPIVRTYKSDAEETIKSGHISSINIAIAESNKMLKRSQEQQGVDPENKKIKINKTILITSSVLIIGGILAIGIPYFLVNRTNKTEVTNIKDISKPIITADVSEKINTNSLNLTRVSTTLKERVDQSFTKLGQIKNFYLTEGQDSTETTITSLNFLNLIKATVPAEIGRTLQEQYMFGMHNFDGNQRFLILKTDSYDTAYSGMLYWETDLWQDFKEIFNLQSRDIESTTTESFGIEVKKFQDIIFNNKDCRVVKNSEGEIIFLYSIVDKNTIVITTNTNTLKELINRINRAATITQ